MNSAIVLLVLLLAVPLQLFLTHYINTTYTAANADSAETDPTARDVQSAQSAREEALLRLSTGITSMVDYLQDIIQHYSKWGNIKELFVVPYKRGDFKSAEYDSQAEVFLDRTVTMNKFGKKATTKSASTTQPDPSSLPKPDPDKAKPLKQVVKESFESNGEKAKPLKQIAKETAATLKEVEDYLYNEVYFARSKTPRATRPPQVELTVGQVVKHRKEGYFGVIVGWDQVAKASEEWLQRYYSNRQDAIKSPHYLVLVDSRFPESGDSLHYLPQEDLKLVEANIQIQAPELSKYFDGYKNNRHLLRPWLQEIYPEDSN